MWLIFEFHEVTFLIGKRSFCNFKISEILIQNPPLEEAFFFVILFQNSYRGQAFF